MSLSLTARRIILRVLVLVQLALVVLVAWSVRELVSFDNQVPPGMVLLVAAMLASTAVAIRATFRRSNVERGHRLAFMTAEVVCTLSPLAAEHAYGLLRAAPTGVASTGFIELMMGLELVAAGFVAAVAALTAPFLLAPPPESRPDSPYSRALGLWAVVAVVVTLAVGGLYKSSYDRVHTPEFLLEQLFTSANEVQQRLTAEQLVAIGAPAEPETRGRLFVLVESGPADEKIWAAYLLIASGADDGRAMTTLRKMIGGFATMRAVDALVLLGRRSEPAMPELSDVVGRPTSDDLIAEIQSRSADALGGIGSPALGAVPSLVAKLGEKKYFGLRLASASAIDRIDPSYAARCVMGAPTMIDAIPNPDTDVAFKPECLIP